MGKKLKKYYAVYLLGFETALEYRGNFFLNLIGVFFPVMMQYFVWNAVFTGKPAESRMFGLTYEEAVTYTLCAGFIGRLVLTDCHHRISPDIKSGVLSQYLVQPVNYIVSQMFRSVGEKILEFGLVFTVMCTFVFTLSPVIGLTLSPAAFLFFLAALLPAVILNFLLFLCVSMIAFKLTEVGRLYAIVDILVAIVSGGIFPLSIFGGKAEAVFGFLPFTYTTYFLTGLLNGSFEGAEFVKGLCMQGIWIVLLSFLCKAAWKKGLKKYVAVGG